MDDQARGRRIGADLAQASALALLAASAIRETTGLTLGELDFAERQFNLAHFPCAWVAPDGCKILYTRAAREQIMAMINVARALLLYELTQQR